MIVPVIPPLILFSLFFKLIFWQVVVASFVVWGLWVLLNKMLVNAALGHFDRWEDNPAVKQIVFVSHKPLSEKLKERIVRRAKEKFGATVTVTFDVNKPNWGGLLIRIGEQNIDFSLRSRLRQAMRW